MMVFEGIPYFSCPSKVKEFAKKIPELENGLLRVIGLILMSLGLGIVYLGRSMIDNG